MITLERQLRDFVSYEEKQKLSRWQAIVLSKVRESGRAKAGQILEIDSLNLRMVLLRIRRKGIATP